MKTSTAPTTASGGAEPVFDGIVAVNNLANLNLTGAGAQHRK